MPPVERAPPPIAAIGRMLPRCVGRRERMERSEAFCPVSVALSLERGADANGEMTPPESVGTIRPFPTLPL
jgi:hypothetical protein